jgi:hypothetical protein
MILRVQGPSPIITEAVRARDGGGDVDEKRHMIRGETSEGAEGCVGEGRAPGKIDENSIEPYQRGTLTPVGLGISSVAEGDLKPA